MQIVIDERGGRFGWRLVNRTASGADVMARSARTYLDECACRRAAAELVAATGEAMLVVQEPDGHWRWRIAGPDGEPLAESPAVYRDAVTCGRALHDLRCTIVAQVVAR